MAGLDVQSEALRRERRRSRVSSIRSSSGSGGRSGRKTDELDLVRPCRQTWHRLGDRAMAVSASRKCFLSPSVVAAAVATLLFVGLATPATGLVIEEPFQATFDHV